MSSRKRKQIVKSWASCPFICLFASKEKTCFCRWFGPNTDWGKKNHTNTCGFCWEFLAKLNRHVHISIRHNFHVGGSAPDLPPICSHSAPVPLPFLSQSGPYPEPLPIPSQSSDNSPLNDLWWNVKKIFSYLALTVVAFEGIPSWAFVVVFVLQRYDFNKRMLASQDWGSSSHLSSIANPSVSLKFCMTATYAIQHVSSKNCWRTIFSNKLSFKLKFIF